MPNRKDDNDYPPEAGPIDYIDQKRAAKFVDEPITASDDEDKAEHRRQLAKDKEHPAHGLNTKIDEED